MYQRADIDSRDYQARGEEDFYDPEQLDDENVYEDMDRETRRRVEAQLNRRDKELARRGALQRPPAFLDSGPMTLLNPTLIEQRTNLNLLFQCVGDDTMTPILRILLMAVKEW